MEGSQAQKVWRLVKSKDSSRLPQHLNRFQPKLRQGESRCCRLPSTCGQVKAMTKPITGELFTKLQTSIGRPFDSPPSGPIGQSQPQQAQGEQMWSPHLSQVKYDKPQSKFGPTSESDQLVQIAQFCRTAPGRAVSLLLRA